MKKKLIDLSVKDFLAQTASAAPAPGGGGAAALAGALGAALTQMVVNLSSKAEGDAAAALQGIRERGEALQKTLEKNIDADGEAFNAVLAAYRLPKDASGRREAIEEALKTAAAVPLETAAACAEVAGLAREAARWGNPWAASDAEAAEKLARAAFSSAVYNIRVNLSSIKDAAFNRHVEERLAALQAPGPGASSA